MDRRPGSKPSRDAPRNGTCPHDNGNMPVSNGGFPFVHQQRFSTSRSATEAYVSVNKKRGIGHRDEQSPPRKRINPIEPKGAPSGAARLESATKVTTFSAIPSVAKARPESVTPSIGGTAQKAESAVPPMTGRAKSELRTVTSSSSGMNGKDDTSPTATLILGGKVIVAAALAAVKEIISGVPNHWLKTAPKPREASKLQDFGKAKSSDIVSSIVIPRQVMKNDRAVGQPTASVYKPPLAAHGQPIVPLTPQYKPIRREIPEPRRLDLSLVNVKEFTITGLPPGHDEAPMDGLCKKIKEISMDHGVAKYKKGKEGMPGKWRIPLVRFRECWRHLRKSI